ncbi:MAG: hypothetical protein ACK55Z_13810, partial [bacterium]
LSLRRALASGYICVASILCTWYNVSFSSTPSFYVSRVLRGSLSIKKACWRPYTPPIGGDLLSNAVLCPAVSWGPGLLVVPSLPWGSDSRPPGALRPPLLPPQ